VQSGLLLDVVVGEGATILQLLTSKDQTLLIRGNALLVLHDTTNVKTVSRHRDEKEATTQPATHLDLLLDGFD